jgi:23S rRNA pseudouridine1911/1915/1917 synthase
MDKKLKIIYETKDIIVVEKPQGTPTQKDKTGDIDLLTLVSKYLNVSHIDAVHRLDRPVGGLIIFGKNKEAVKKLSKDMVDKNIKKEYLSVVCGKTPKDEVLTNYLIKNQRLNISKVVTKNTPNSKIATLSFTKLQEIETKEHGQLSLLSIKLETGRHHQIRVQLANANYPIWGDTKYNKEFKRVKEFTNIALWSYRLQFFNYEDQINMDLKVTPKDIYPFNQFDITKI